MGESTDQAEKQAQSSPYPLCDLKNQGNSCKWTIHLLPGVTISNPQTPKDNFYYKPAE